jgi:hypothetical protein
VRQLLVELDEIANVDIAVVLLQQGILAQLVPVDENVVEPEVENEGLELALQLQVRVLALFKCRRENMRRVDRLPVHGDVVV